MSWDPAMGRTGNGSVGELNVAANPWSPQGQQSATASGQYALQAQSMGQPGMLVQQSSTTPQHSFSYQQQNPQYSGMVSSSQGQNVGQVMVAAVTPQGHATATPWAGGGAPRTLVYTTLAAAPSVQLPMQQAQNSAQQQAVQQHAALQSQIQQQPQLVYQQVAQQAQQQWQQQQWQQQQQQQQDLRQQGYGRGNTPRGRQQPQQKQQQHHQKQQHPQQHPQSGGYRPGGGSGNTGRNEDGPDYGRGGQDFSRPGRGGRGRGSPGGPGRGNAAGRGGGGEGAGRGGGVGVMKGEVRGEKKRGRGEEPENAAGNGKGKGKGNSKGGAKASRREVEGMPRQQAAYISPSAAMPMEEDGVPYAASPSSSKTKKKGKNAGRGVYTPPPSGIGPTAQPTTPKAVAGVDRAAGKGHWTSLIQTPIESNSKGGRAQGRTGNNNSRASPTAPAAAPVAEEKPPTPMREGPAGSGKRVVDKVAHARMFPGGAVLNMKGFQLKHKSAVSAAFELCVAMEPKTRPKFEYKDNDKGAKAPFTLNMSVNGVAYSPATAKSVKLAKQLAAVNFLREAVGTRKQLDLESLANEAGGGVAANAAISAAVKGKGKGKGKAAAAAAAAAATAAGGEAEGASAAGTTDDEAAKLALDDGTPNYAQLLHDLVAAHPETPTYTSYAFRALKENVPKKAVKTKGKGFRCTARLLRHTVNAEETEKRKKIADEKKALADAAKEALEANPEDETLIEASKKAHKEHMSLQAIPMLDIKVLNAVGDGPSKRDAKHKAAEAMAYILLPDCKTDEEMRALATTIMEKYQAAKKERMEEEQRVAQKAKALREAAEAAAAKAKIAAEGDDPAAAIAAEAEAAAAAAAAEEAATESAAQSIGSPMNRQQMVMRQAINAAGRAAGGITGEAKEAAVPAGGGDDTAVAGAVGGEAQEDVAAGAAAGAAATAASDVVDGPAVTGSGTETDDDAAAAASPAGADAEEVSSAYEDAPSPVAATALASPAPATPLASSAASPLSTRGGTRSTRASRAAAAAASTNVSDSSAS